MRLTVKVKPRSSQNKMVCVDGIYTVYLKNSPVENKANVELINVLSKHFNVAKKDISIYRGLKSKTKIVDITQDAGLAK